MPVTLTKVVDHVVAIEEEAGPVDRHKVAAMVRETIAALGLLVNASNDEVYNPAPAPSRIPEDNWRRGAKYPKSRYR